MYSLHHLQKKCDQDNWILYCFEEKKMKKFNAAEYKNILSIAHCAKPGMVSQIIVPIHYYQQLIINKHWKKNNRTISSPNLNALSPDTK